MIPFPLEIEWEIEKEKRKRKRKRKHECYVFVERCLLYGEWNQITLPSFWFEHGVTGVVLEWEGNHQFW